MTTEHGPWGARIVSAWVALALQLAPSASSQGCPTPTLRTITIDGAFEDWTEGLSNGVNAFRDGDGSTVPCGISTDLDCPISSTERDLIRFAWTADATRLYMYFERLSGAGGAKYTVAYLDLDHDGLMEATDVVIKTGLETGSAFVAGDIRGYDPFAPAGDPMTDPGGLADGWTLPGNDVDIGGAALAPAAAATPSGLIYEQAVTWADLGIVPGAPLFIHPSLASSGDIPNNIVDNVGGSGGGSVDTAFAAVSLGPTRCLGAAPGTTARFEHVVVNAGNLADRIDLGATSAVGHDITWTADRDGDGTYEISLGFDAGGDGIMTLPGDTLDPAGDSNADGVLDLGIVPAGGSVGLMLSVAVPAGASGVTDSLDVTARSSNQAACGRGVLDLLRIGELTLLTDERKLAVPGSAAWLPHVVQNNLPTASVANFSVISVRGWGYAFFDDPDQDGNPADAVAMLDADLDGKPDLTLMAGEQRRMLVRASVPAAAPLGQTETAFVRAHLDGPPLSAVVDRITLGDALVLAPDYLRIDGNARYGAAGGPVYFPHRVINGDSAQADFDVSATSDLGWAVTLLSDPDGDGKPYDSLPLVPARVSVAINGGEVPIIVRLDVPPGTALGDTSRVTVEARGVDDPSVFARASDDGVVAIVRVFDDPARVASVADMVPCATVYCLASNLPPGSPDYRFEWRDDAGVPVRLSPVTTSSLGECGDELALGPADAGNGWSVAIQHLETGAWVTLDVATFAVGDALRAVGLSLDAPAYDISASAFSAALEVTNTSPGTGVSGESLRWAVLTPDLTRVLLPDRTWAPWTGSQATQVDALDLAPGASRVYGLFMTGIVFPMPGSYPMRVYRSAACAAGGTLLTEASLLVTEDQDGDGLATADEVAAGTDPSDADSDDDGIADGADGLGDADSDGLADALDCDSDNDGLPDGLESGVVVPLADTDVASACFRADADPATVTDPDAADTDGGGIEDGTEDANGNGAVDSGERDPFAAGDDACATSLPDEVRDLRVRRAGDAAVLTWTPVADPCATYIVEDSSALPVMSDAATGLLSATFTDARPLLAGPLRCYLIVAESAFSGRGPNGLQR